MPQPGMRWRHVTLSTLNSWLPGDPRGFRTKNHKVHSSGDYKSPPPPGEHQGLHEYSKKISGDPVILPPDARPVAGRTILKNLKKQGYRVLAVSVAGMHVHIQIELPDDRRAIRKIIGRCKTAASHAVREWLPGRVWGREGGFKPIDDAGHQRNVLNYIKDQENAWVWTFQDEEPEGEELQEEEARRLEDSPAGLEQEGKEMDKHKPTPP